MKITALVENKTTGDLKTQHGLSLYIETPKHKILFDVGPDNTLLENADKKGIDLSMVDIVIISHGHMDHGGALQAFLEINNKAKIYVQKTAFDKHYSKILFFKADIGLDPNLRAHPQVVLVDGDYEVDDELALFVMKNREKCYSNANDKLCDANGQDAFLHEQNLIIKGDPVVLIIGCGHTGVVNILERAKDYRPKVCIGGYHLFNPANKKTVPDELLDEIALELSKYDMKYYTCHCTGQAAFDYLAARIGGMFYLSCGETIEL